MPVSIVVDQFVLSPAESTSAQITAQNLVFAAMLWGTVAVVYAASRGKLEAQPDTRDRPA